MKSYKNRQVDYTKPVQVYKNLTKKTYSIRQNGLVVGHSNKLLLVDCKFIVNEKGRQRVLTTGHKNVHAFIEGKLVNSCYGVGISDNFDGKNRFPCHIVYNPKFFPLFTCVNLTKEPFVVKYCSGVQIDSFGVYGAHTNV